MIDEQSRFIRVKDERIDELTSKVETMRASHQEELNKLRHRLS